jgi:DNA polymerase-4
VRDPVSIHAMLCGLCERVCWRARARGIQGRTVTLKLRYANFDTLSRSRTISPTCSERELYPVVLELFERNRRRRTAVRLLGVALSNLSPHAAQLGLFESDAGLNAAVDSIRERFGFDAVRSALAITHKRERSE